MAMRDLWLLGDEFLRQTFPALQEMKSSAASFNPHQIPYMYEQYNIYSYTKSSMVSQRNTLVRVQKAMEEAFSRKWHLPKYIIVMLDRDILHMINSEASGLTKAIERCLHYFARELASNTEDRMETFAAQRPGAAIDEPTIIWVEMFDRAYIGYTYAMRNINKFNKVLNDVAMREKNSKVMSIADLHFQHFDHLGELNSQGKKKFWQIVDNLL